MLENNTPEPGIYENVPFEEYLKWDCFNKSKVLPILKSVKHMLMEKKATAPMNTGNLVETLLLEPHLFEDHYSFLPQTYTTQEGNVKPWSANSNDRRKELQDIIDSGKIPVKVKDEEDATIIIDAIRSHRTANEMLSNGKPQVSIVWKDETTGLLCKARIDYLKEKLEINDLKMTNDASPTEFSRTITKFGYDIQACMYQEGYFQLTGERLPFQFVVGEYNEPYCVSTFNPEGEVYEAGKNRFSAAIKKYAEYKRSGIATGYSEFLEPINIKLWAHTDAQVVADLMEVDNGI